MKKVEIIGYPKCSTCRNAVKYVKNHGIEVTFRDIVTETPSVEELTMLWKKSGLPLTKFFNTSGNLYKEMQLKDKLSSMSEEEQLVLLSHHGMLIKRPILIDGDIVLVGFQEKNYDNLWAEA